MKSEWLFGFAILAFAARLAAVLRLWTFPRKNGDGWLFGRRIDPAAYATNGVSLIRHYRVALLLGLLFDTRRPGDYAESGVRSSASGVRRQEWM